MTIETTIAANTAAMIALTEALIATANLAPAGEVKPAAAAKPAAKPAAKKEEEEPAGPTREEVVALMGALKDKFDVATAKALVKKFGKADKLAEAEDKYLPAIFKAATEKLAEEDDGV